MEASEWKGSTERVALDSNQAQAWLCSLDAPWSKRLESQMGALAAHSLRSTVLEICCQWSAPSRVELLPRVVYEDLGNLRRGLVERCRYEFGRGPAVCSLMERVELRIERRFRNGRIELQGELEQVLALCHSGRELWCSRSASLEALKKRLVDRRSEQPGGSFPEARSRLSRPLLRSLALLSLCLVGILGLWQLRQNILWHQCLAELGLGPRPEAALQLRAFAATSEQLRDALQSRNPWRRTNALLALDPGSEIQAIRPFLRDPAGLVRLTALRIGLRVDDELTLTAGLKSPFPELRDEALRASREGPIGGSALAELAESAFEEESWSAAQRVVMGGRSATPEEIAARFEERVAKIVDPAELLAWVHVLNDRGAWSEVLQRAFLRRLTGLERRSEESLALERWGQKVNATLHDRGEESR